MLFMYKVYGKNVVYLTLKSSLFHFKGLCENNLIRVSNLVSTYFLL